MKRYVVGRFVALAAVLLKDHCTKSESMEMLDRVLGWLNERSNDSVEARSGLERSLAVLRSLPSAAGFEGLIAKHASIQSEPERSTTPETDCMTVAREWAQGAPDDLVVQRGVVVNGIGRFLESLANSETPEKAELVRVGAEGLLRHLEVARKGAMQRFRVPISDHESLAERCELAIFLARHACRANDVRFLNAALKLNGWAGGIINRREETKVISRFAEAISEQEVAAFAMLT